MSEKKYAIVEIKENKYGHIAANDGKFYLAVGQISPITGPVAVFEAVIKLLLDTKHRVRYGKPEVGEQYLPQEVDEESGVELELGVASIDFVNLRLIIDPPEPEVNEWEKWREQCPVNEMCCHLTLRMRDLLVGWLKTMPERPKP